MARRLSTAPLPGRPVRGSRTGRPLMALLDLLGRRWALRLLWELREGRLTFRELQAACGGLSPTVLRRRTAELREAGIADVAPGGGYGLTAQGRALVGALEPLWRWAGRWKPV